MFCLLQSARLAEPPAPPPADKLPDSDALAAAFALASALEVELLELLSVFVEVDGAVGVEGGVQVGQLVPPLLHVVAREAELAMASAAAMRRWLGFKVGPSWWGFVGGLRQHLADAPLDAAEGEHLASAEDDGAVHVTASDLHARDESKASARGFDEQDQSALAFLRVAAAVMRLPHVRTSSWPCFQSSPKIRSSTER